MFTPSLYSLFISIRAAQFAYVIDITQNDRRIFACMSLQYIMLQGLRHVFTPDLTLTILDNCAFWKLNWLLDPAYPPLTLGT